MRPVALHTPAIARAQKKLLRAYGSLMASLMEIGVPEDERRAVQGIVAPHLTGIEGLLNVQAARVSGKHRTAGGSKRRRAAGGNVRGLQ